MLVSNFQHQINAADVSIGHEPETSRSLGPLILEDHDVVYSAELRKILLELNQLQIVR